MKTDGKPEAQEINSWKEIAAYLGVTVRTAQRWEAEWGLPVRRDGGGRGRVAADSAELDRWKQSVLAKAAFWASPRFLGICAGISTVLLAVAVCVILKSYWRVLPGEPALYHVDGGTLIVTDARGREVWRKAFSQGLQTAAYMDESNGRMALFEDLDGDRGIETVFAYLPQGQAQFGSALICFSSKGQEKWRFVPGSTAAARIGRTPPNHRILKFLITEVGKERQKRILVISHNLGGGAFNQFAVLDPSGRIVGECWHHGTLDKMEVWDLDGDGVPDVLLAGLNGGSHTATLVVFDPRRVAGATRQEGPELGQFAGLPEGTEKARIVFPRTCVNRKLETYSYVSWLSVTQDTVFLRTVEGGARSLDRIYELGHRLKVKDCAWADWLKMRHRELEVEGALDHRLTEKEIEESCKPQALRGLR